MIDNEISQTVPVKSSRKPKNSMPIKIDIPQPELMKPKITIFGDFTYEMDRLRVTRGFGLWY